MSIISPNMNLVISTVGVDSGLNWENNLNSSLTLIDLHDHTPGKGVAITPASLNINTDLPLNNNNLTLTRSVRFQSQPAALALVTDIGCIYESGVDLYYNDGSGNQIRITQSGSLAGAAGTITGLPSGTASAAFAAGVFTFQASTATGANIDGASFVFRNNTANSHGLTLSPPNAMAADYSLILPSLPVVTSFLTLDSSGNISASPALLGALTTTNLSATAGIVGTQLSATANIAGSQLVTNITLAGSLTTTTSLVVGTTLNVTGTTTAATVNTTTTTASSNMTITGKNVATSNTNAATGLGIIRINIAPNGSITAGEGASVNHSGTGTYRLTWSTAFSDVPAVTAILATGSFTTDYVNISAVTNSFVDIYSNDNTGSPKDNAFNLIAIGAR